MNVLYIVILNCSCNFTILFKNSSPLDIWCYCMSEMVVKDKIIVLHNKYNPIVVMQKMFFVTHL